MMRASESIRLAVVTAGMGEPSSTSLLGSRLADAAVKALATAGVHAQVEEIRLRGLAHGIADHLTMGFPSGKLAQALDTVRAADAVIAVTPTFKAGYAGLFKSFWDLTEDGDIAGTPLLLAATGGTSRHSLMIDTALRPLFAYLRADMVPTGVFAATDDFGADSALQARIDRAGGELAQRVAWRLGGRLESGAPDAEAAAAASGSPDEHDDAAPDAPIPAAIPDVDAARSVDSELNAGQDESFRSAQGLAPLKVTPFEDLLGK